MSLRPASTHSIAIGAGANWEALAAALPPGARVNVCVADCLVRYFLLEVPQGIASLRDCRLLLAARFAALYGDNPADWVLQADWQAGAPMLACAMPRALHNGFAPFKRVSLQPQLLRDWNARCARLERTGAWCSSADGMLNLLYWEDGVLRLVRQQRGHDPELLLAQELARLGAPLPAARYWHGAAA